MEKNGKKYPKYAKIRDVKILQDVLFNQEFFNNLFSNPGAGSLALKAEKSKNDKKNWKKNLEKASFIKKIAKICDIKKLKKYSMTITNLSVTYYLKP